MPQSVIMCDYALNWVLHLLSVLQGACGCLFTNQVGSTQAAIWCNLVQLLERIWTTCRWVLPLGPGTRQSRVLRYQPMISCSQRQAWPAAFFLDHVFRVIPKVLQRTLHFTELPGMAFPSKIGWIWHINAYNMDESGFHIFPFPRSIPKSYAMEVSVARSLLSPCVSLFFPKMAMENGPWLREDPVWMHANWVPTGEAFIINHSCHSLRKQDQMDCRPRHFDSSHREIADFAASSTGRFPPWNRNPRASCRKRPSSGCGMVSRWSLKACVMVSLAMQSWLPNAPNELLPTVYIYHIYPIYPFNLSTFLNLVWSDDLLGILSYPFKSIRV